MKITQEAQVIEVMRNEGGFATFKRLNELLGFSNGIRIQKGLTLLYMGQTNN